MCLYGVHTDKIVKLKAENRKLKVENEELQAKVLLSESQNYCKICGNTLDGYKPKKG